MPVHLPQAAVARRTLPLTLVAALWGCPGGQGDDDQTSPSPSITSALGATDAPTPTRAPGSGVILVGTGTTDARAPSATPTPQAAPRAEGDTPSPAPPTTPSPSPAAATATSPYVPTRWAADLTVTVTGLPGGARCSATLSEVGAPSAGGCEGCDAAFTVTRALVRSDGVCQWASSETLELAFFRADGRMDRYLPPEDGAEIGRWQPWYLLTSGSIHEDEASPGRWVQDFTVTGHPDAGFAPAPAAGLLPGASR